MARLTNGTFKYTRRVKPGDPNEYNAPFKEATAEISWLGDENEAVPSVLAFADLAREQAVHQVNLMLGVRPPAVEQKIAVELPTPAVAPSYIPPPPTPAVAPIATIEAAGVVLDKAIIEGIAAKKVAKDAMAAPAQSVTLQTAADDDLLGDVTAAAPIAYTPTDIVNAITTKNAERQSRPEGSMLNGKDARAATVLRELIANYVTAPQHAQDIPAELRGKFLEELKKL